jgi:hypothetical protein
VELQRFIQNGVVIIEPLDPFLSFVHARFVIAAAGRQESQGGKQGQAAAKSQRWHGGVLPNWGEIGPQGP